VTERDRTKSLVSEQAVLVGVFLPDRKHHDEELHELQGLADTAGCETVGILTQNRERPDAGSYLGSGKVEELRLLVEATEADVVIFDNDLSPAQTRTLERAISVKVLDRTELILDIFASHAQTYESRLAVELAQLNTRCRDSSACGRTFRGSKWASACAGRAKNSWKWTAGWSKSAFTI
jgi:GTPase